MSKNIMMMPADARGEASRAIGNFSREINPGNRDHILEAVGSAACIACPNLEIQQTENNTGLPDGKLGTDLTPTCVATSESGLPNGCSIKTTGTTVELRGFEERQRDLNSRFEDNTVQLVTDTASGRTTRRPN